MTRGELRVPVPGSWFLVLGSSSELLCGWNLEPGTRNREPGTSHSPLLRELDDHVPQRHLALTALGCRGPRASAQYPRTRAEDFERLVDVRNSLGTERGVGVGKVEMKVWLGRVTGITNEAEHLAPPHSIPGPHAQ